MLHQWLRRLRGARTGFRTVALRLEDLEARTVPATTLTWTGNGGDNLWSDAANWTPSGGGDTTPHNGDTVIFPDGAKALSTQNDIANLTLASIQFTGAGYDLTGNALSLSGGIMVAPATPPTGGAPAPDTIDDPLTLVQGQRFIVAAGAALFLNAGVTANGPNLTLDGAGTVAFGGISEIFSTLEVLHGTAQVNGSLSVSTGRLTVDHDATLTDSGSVTASSGGRIDDHGKIVVAAPDASGHGGGNLALTGGSSTLTVETDGRLTDAGNVTVGNKGSTLDDQGSLTIARTGTLDDQGRVTVGANVNAATATLNDFGILNVDANAALGVTGTLTVEQDASLTDAGTVTVSKQGVQEGLLDDHGDIEVAAPGSVSLSGGGLTVESDGRLTDAGSVTVAGKGALTDDHSVVIASTGKLDDGGTVAVGTGATLDDGGSVTVEAAGRLNNQGTLTVEPDHTLKVSGTAALVGSAQTPAALTATLTNNATPALALASGALDLDATSTGTTKLNLTTAADFAPTLGQPFTLVANATGKPVKGLFDAPDGKPLQEGDTVHVGAYDFTITYKGGSGNDVVLTYAGLRRFDITIANKLSTPLTLDGVILPASGAVKLAAGVHTLADQNNPGSSVTFKVNADGTVSYTTPSGVLTGAGTNALGVQGVPVTIDATALAGLTSAFSADGSLYLTGRVEALNLLPGTFAVTYSVNGTTTALNFAVSPQDQVTFAPSDPSQNGLAGVRGSNDVHLLAPVVPPVPVIFNAVALAQVDTTTFTVNGQSYPLRQQDGTYDTILLPPGAFVVRYTAFFETVTLNFNVSPQDQVTSAPNQDRLVTINGSNVVTLLTPALSAA